MQINPKELAILCKEIIVQPENNIKKIKSILNIKANNEEEITIIYISVLKVFKSIIPLYKIRTLKEKIKHKKENLEIDKTDKDILNSYSYFINRICSESSYISYFIATEILDYFEHFNYTDIIVKKILKRTTKNGKTHSCCLLSLQKKIEEDVVGEIIFCIVNQMYETSFHPEVLKFLLDLNPLKELISEDKKIEKDRFFKVCRSYKKTERKLEKCRRKIEIEQRKIECQNEKEEKFIFHRKLLDGLQRLYFLILKHKIKQKFKYTYIGLRKYKKYIRTEFLEGLYILLNECLVLSDSEAKLYCILTILDIYESCRYDFKKLVQELYNIICPFSFLTGRSVWLLIEQVINHLFVESKQPMKRVHVIIERLLFYNCIRYNQIAKRITIKLISFYDIDTADIFKFIDNDLSKSIEKDIDLIEIRPLFCYEVFKKSL